MAVNQAIYNDVWLYDDMARRVINKLFDRKNSDTPFEQSRGRVGLVGVAHLMDALEHGDIQHIKESLEFLSTLVPPTPVADALPDELRPDPTNPRIDLDMEGRDL